jgi:hypothetical protein
MEDLVVMMLGWILGIGLMAIVAWFLYKPYSRIPEPHRTTPAFLPWLACVPILGFVILWLLVPFKIPSAMKSYFAEQGLQTDKQNDDFGFGLGLAWVISSTLCIIPIINFVAWIPALVLPIIYLVKLNKLGNVLPTPPPKPATSPAFTPANPGSRAAQNYEQLEREQEATRLIFKREWTGRDIWVTFTDSETGVTFRYPHDQMLQVLMDQLGIIRGTRSWEENGLYHFPHLSEKQRRLLAQYTVKTSGLN